MIWERGGGGSQMPNEWGHILVYAIVLKYVHIVLMLFVVWHCTSKSNPALLTVLEEGGGES